MRKNYNPDRVDEIISKLGELKGLINELSNTFDVSQAAVCDWIEKGVSRKKMESISKQQSAKNDAKEVLSSMGMTYMQYLNYLSKKYGIAHSTARLYFRKRFTDNQMQIKCQRNKGIPEEDFIYHGTPLGDYADDLDTFVPVIRNMALDDIEPEDFEKHYEEYEARYLVSTKQKRLRPSDMDGHLTDSEIKSAKALSMKL